MTNIYDAIKEKENQIAIFQAQISGLQAEIEALRVAARILEGGSVSTPDAARKIVARFPLESKVEVFFDPEDETVSTLDRSGSKVRWVLLAGAVLFCGAALATALTMLAPGGVFAFTLETHDGDGVVIGAGLRYAHGKRIVREKVAGAGLELAYLEEASPRTEDNEPVRGLVVVAAKT